jgi:hypothetical protein
MATIILPSAAPPAPLPPGLGPITLAQLEQEVAARLGPFELLETRDASASAIAVEVLKSTIDLGGLVDLFVLRREAARAEDRVARVKAYDPVLGQLLVDRAYTTVPLPSEPIELHHLNPALLRRGVRAGLRRCFFQDWLPLQEADPEDPTAPLLPTTGPVDLTEYSGGWLRAPQQVLDVVDPQSAGAPAGGVAGWRAYGHAGRCFLLQPLGVQNVGLAVVAVREHFTLVDGAYAPDGPTADDQLLDVDLDYAAAFGHIELWRIAQPQLESVAAETRQSTRDQAAAEATRMAVAHAPWRFLPRGGRPERVAPLWGLRGALGAGATPSLVGVAVNGPDWMAPTHGVRSLAPGDPDGDAA